MQTRLQRVGRGVVAPCAAVLLGLSAFGVTTAEAASPEQGGCSIGVLGVCLVGTSPTPAPGATQVAPTATPAQASVAAVATASPTPRPAPTATPRPAAAATTSPTHSPAPAGSGLAGLGGVVSGLLGATPAPQTSGSSTAPASAPTCIELLGNCISLGPSPAPSPNGTGVVISLPTGNGTSQPLLGIGQTGCVAALVGSCVVGNTPTNPSSCVASLLTLCVSAPASTPPLPQMCLPSDLLCVGSASSPGSSPSATQGAAPSTQAAGPAGAVGAPASTGAPAAQAGVAPSGSPTPPPNGTPSGASGDTIPSVVAESGALAGLAGLHLGSIFIWPVFAVLDLVAAAVLIRLARRSRTAVPAD